MFMKTQTSTKQMYCPAAAVRYARVLYELQIPKQDIQKTKEIITEVPLLRDVFINPTIEIKNKMSVVDQVFPESMRNFLKVVCKYHKLDLIDEIFYAYENYCDKQSQILNAVLTCVEPPSEDQLKKMKAFLCDKYHMSEARIEIITDPGLLGGFILRTGCDEYDWSLKGRLTRLEQKLTWR